MIETYRGVVRPHQLDHMGHMNVQWYTAVFDEATWHLLSALGLTSRYFRDESRGMAAVQQTTQYRKEVMAGQLLVCCTEALEVGGKTVRFVHHLHDAEEDFEIATTELVAVHMDTQERRSCALPGFVAAHYRDL